MHDTVVHGPGLVKMTAPPARSATATVNASTASLEAAMTRDPAAALLLSVALAACGPSSPSSPPPGRATAPAQDHATIDLVRDLAQFVTRSARSVEELIAHLGTSQPTSDGAMQIAPSDARLRGARIARHPEGTPFTIALELARRIGASSWKAGSPVPGRPSARWPSGSRAPPPSRSASCCGAPGSAWSRWGSSRSSRSAASGSPRATSRTGAASSTSRTGRRAPSAAAASGFCAARCNRQAVSAHRVSG